MISVILCGIYKSKKKCIISKTSTSFSKKIYWTKNKCLILFSNFHFIQTLELKQFIRYTVSFIPLNVKYWLRHFYANASFLCWRISALYFSVYENDSLAYKVLYVNGSIRISRFYTFKKTTQYTVSISPDYNTNTFRLVVYVIGLLLFVGLKLNLNWTYFA